MEELQGLLAKREMVGMVSFDHQNNRIRCYAHIINICSSHVVASVTSTSKSYLSGLKVPSDPKYATRNDADSDEESDDDDIDDEDYELELPRCYDRRGSSTFRDWAEAIKRDPLRRARISKVHPRW